MTDLLTLTDLVVDIPHRRGTLRAIDGVSLSIARGEVLGLVGESGAGKSMIGNAVIGLLARPAHVAGGEIWLGDRRIDRLAPHQMRQLRGRRIGMIFQDPQTSLNPLMRIGDQLVETIRLHRPMPAASARTEAIRLLDEVGIPAPEERMAYWPHQFSGGQRQRIVIALALAGEPELIIADEPTTALDVSVQAQIIRLLKRLCADRGVAVMLITHDMGVIAETADRVCVLYAGRVAETGPVTEVLSRPRHPYTVGLMDAIPSLDPARGEPGVATLRQIPGAMPSIAARPSGCAFHPRCASATPDCARVRPDPRPAGRSEVACPVCAPTHEDAAS
ncbi:ABC transporter ATP-binding protein [Roseovarius sp.]|uniref:ABC transporter ATP-binding protein n=1 Tax=Roseovarius sp. TaxID=1486281 RepID=UPI002621A3B6|nr:ABC transporter ATP-binding protein [Roseovarius sp.]MDM8164829.1 ABC transporter ATP-binding protein [Roseovarius sp.]